MGTLGKPPLLSHDGLPSTLDAYMLEKDLLSMRTPQVDAQTRGLLYTRQHLFGGCRALLWRCLQLFVDSETRYHQVKPEDSGGGILEVSRIRMLRVDVHLL